MEKINYKIKANSFELADIFDCGQCFRWNIEDDGSYTGVFKKIVLNVKKMMKCFLMELIMEILILLKK